MVLNESRQPYLCRYILASRQPAGRFSVLRSSKHGHTIALSGMNRSPRTNTRREAIIPSWKTVRTCLRDCRQCVSSILRRHASATAQDQGPYGSWRSAVVAARGGGGSAGSAAARRVENENCRSGVWLDAKVDRKVAPTNVTGVSKELGAHS